MNPSPSRWRRVLRWTRRAALGIVAFLAIALLVVYVVSEQRLGQTFEVPPVGLARLASVPDAALVARGEHLVAVRGCNDCHGADLGGKVMVDDPALGRIVAANLTRGGATREFSMADWDRAIRHGIAPSGRGLLVMPANEFNVIGDQDLAAIVAYLESLPPVQRALPANSVRPLGRALYVAGVLPLLPAEIIDHGAARAATPAAAPTPEYGAYVSSGCVGCHGRDFGGATVPGLGITGANLTMDRETGLGTWTEAQFAHALRTGRRPDGTALDPAMPVAMTRQLTDTEVAAIWAFLQTLPPVHKPAP